MSNFMFQGEHTANLVCYGADETKKKVSKH